MAMDPLSLLLVGGTTAVSAASSIGQAQAQNKLIKETKKKNAVVAKINADQRREQIAAEFGQIMGALRVSAGERGSAQARSSGALAVSSAAQAARSNSATALEEYFNATAGQGVYENPWMQGILGGLQGLQAGMNLSSGISGLKGT